MSPIIIIVVVVVIVIIEAGSHTTQPNFELLDSGKHPISAYHVAGIKAVHATMPGIFIIFNV